MLELWGMWSTPLIQLSGEGAPDKDLSIGQVELNCVIMLT